MADEAPPAPTAAAKKKKDEKYKKRDPRSWENIMRATANMSLEERQQYLETVYNQLYTENRTSYANLQAREKQYTQCLKEHEKDRAELTKSILARGQLESLCRELQKQNKAIKEENVARIKEEEDRRREVANTFNERLNALTSLITESKDKSNKVNEENQNMTQKLTELYEQYQQRENHLETVTRQMDLQKKLAETQAKKVEIEHEAEKQTLLAQKKALELQLEQYERELVLYQEKNRSLEAQVDLYKSQYSDFETTMSKSNKVFDTFKEEMSRMSKQLHTLETERNDLRKRWQSSVNSLIVLSEQHVALSNEQSALEKKLQMLQKLCRQLQEDRSAFLRQLKENNIEPIVSSLKNGEKGESEEQEAEETKDARLLKLKEEMDKAKAKMAESNLSTLDTESKPAPECVNTKESECLQFISQAAAVTEATQEKHVPTSTDVNQKAESPTILTFNGNSANDSTNVSILEGKAELNSSQPSNTAIESIAPLPTEKTNPASSKEVPPNLAPSSLEGVSTTTLEFTESSPQ